MKHIEYKKTFWMNLVASLFTILGAFMFLYEYLEVSKYEKVFNALFWMTPLITMATLYKNDKSILLTLSLLLNLVFSLFFGYFALNFIYIHQYLVIIPMLIVMIPFGINLKQLLKMRGYLA